MARELTAKQARFVEEYLIDLNATQAAIRSGYSARTAEWIGPQLLGKSHVATAIQAAKEKRSEKTGFTAEQVLLELHELHQKSLRPLVDAQGNECMEAPAVAAKCLDMKMRHLGLFDADRSKKSEVHITGFRVVAE